MFKTRIPPPIYALSLALLMWMLHQYLPLLQWLNPPWSYLGVGLIIIAGLADLWSLFLFFKARTTPNPMHPERTQQLVTSGLYRYSRNPMYVGMLLMLIGWWLYLGSLSPAMLLPLFIWIINHQQILPEEAALGAKFGEAYKAYCQHVPRWLI